MSGTAASFFSSEEGDVSSHGDLLSTLASLGLGVEGACATAFGVGQGLSSNNWESIANSSTAAKISSGIEGGSTAASASSGGGGEWVDSSRAALVDSGVISGESAAKSNVCRNASNLGLGGGDGGDGLAAIAVLSSDGRGFSGNRAASLSCWVVRRGSAAFEVCVRVTDDGVASTAKLGGGGEDSGSTAGSASPGVDNAGAASLGGWIESSGELSGITALEVVVGVGDDLVEAAKLGGGVESGGATAGLSVGCSIGNDGGATAKIGGLVVASGTAALKSSVAAGNNASTAAKLGAWVVTLSSAAL